METDGQEPDNHDLGATGPGTEDSSIHYPGKDSKNLATRSDYKMLIERSWADIHHSRIQEWRALLAITAGHVLIWQGVQFLPQATSHWRLPAAMGLGAAAAFVAIVGCLISWRHRKLMRVKLCWIYKAEDYLGLIKRDGRNGGIIPANRDFERDIQWEGWERLRPGSTTWYITLLYGILVVFDLLAGLSLAIGTP